MHNFLDIRRIHKSFGKTLVLQDITIAAAEGEFLVLVGPSGCGKSTLLSIIAGLETADSGAIHIGGDDMTARRPAERDIAMVFQSYALYPNMTVRQNIAFGMEMRGVPKAARALAVDKVAATLHIEALLDRKPSQLSGGQRQRVAMGRALVRQPRVFLFDEPLSNLDAKLRVDMRTEIKKLHQTLGTTIVYVTHDQIEAMTLATRIAVMQGGIVRQLGTPDDIYNHPADLFVATFMGSPEMNLLHGKFHRDASGAWADINGTRLPLPTPPAALPDASPIIIGIRPEHITDTAIPENTHPMTITAEVIEPAGADTYVIGKLGAQPITARLRAQTPGKPGDQIHATYDPTRTLVFDPKTKKRL